MSRTDRLFQIIEILRDGQLHLARDLAAQLGVSERTLYRDMDRLKASGVPVAGERGVGYQVQDVIALPPLTLTPEELEALNLGMAIVAEAADPGLKTAALSLAAKIDTVLPVQGIAEAEAWKYAFHPFADAARSFGHIATLRAAIRGHQKLQIQYLAGDTSDTESRRIRPLSLDYWGRVWVLVAWCETRNAFQSFRVDLITTAAALPELFVDEPGKTLADYQRGSRIS